MKKIVNTQDKNGHAGSFDEHAGQYLKGNCVCTEYFLSVYEIFVMKYTDVV